MTKTRPLLAGIELGGTKCVCLIGYGPDEVLAQTEIATGIAPDATLQAIESQLETWTALYGSIGALGVASFGPIDLDPQSRLYGHITTTAKPGWCNVDLVGRLARRLKIPIGFDTDVNGAAHAEGRWGAAQGLRHFAYVTVGTGIGVGIVTNGQSLQGIFHPEMGHIRIVRQAEDSWSGSCPFHGDCLEGLASGEAIRRRIGQSPKDLPLEHPVWASVAHALGQLLHVMVVSLAPERILLGGGVIAGQPHLLVRLRTELSSSLNHYLLAPELQDQIDAYVRAPALGAMAGPLGALALAARRLESQGG